MADQQIAFRRGLLTELVLGIFRVNGDLLASGDELVRDLGLTSARWQVLGAVAFAPAPLPVAHLARNMGLTRQAVQRSVDDMCVDGLVRLETNPHHRRAMLVTMTAQGKEVFDAASRRQAVWADRLAEGLEADDLAKAVTLLCKLQRRLDAADQPLSSARPDKENI